MYEPEDLGSILYYRESKPAFAYPGLRGLS